MNIKAHLVLSEGNDGQLALYLNDEEILRYTGRTEFIDGGSIYGAEVGNYRYGEAGASTMILDDVLVCADEPRP